MSSIYQQSNFCKMCKKHKPISDFGRRGNYAILDICKPCSSESRAEYLKKYRESKQTGRNYLNISNGWYKPKNKPHKQGNPSLFKLKKKIRDTTRYFTLVAEELPDTHWFRDVLGCDTATLRQHIESKFTEGMRWDKFGLYLIEIDHIVPLSSATNESEMLKLAHYTNLQPLWYYDNRKKYNKHIK